jgi:DNA-binding transcriptional LysR family regulator
MYLAACTPAAIGAPLPTPVQLVVAHSPALRNLTDWVSTCADEQSEAAFFLDEISEVDPKINQVDLLLWLGNPPSDPGFSAPIAVEEIVIIVNPGNSLREISSAEIASLFSGQISSWNSLGASSAEVKGWTFTPGSEIYKIFAGVFLHEKAITSQSQVAPSPTAMLQAVAEDESAIGYIPRSWINDSVRMLKVSDLALDTLQLPVLALSESEPTGVARNFLACLQSPKGQRSLPSGYQPWNANLQVEP